MGIIRKIIFSGLFALFALSTSFAQETTLIDHEVTRGETRYGIARQYSISMEVLEKQNPEIKEGLKIGMILKIPVKTHTVKPGETIYSLTRKYSITQEQLEKANPDLKNGLKPNQLLRIPEPEPKEEEESPNSDYILHKVVAKETAYSLSKKYNTSIDTLYLLNPAAKSGLWIGQILKFPKGKVNEASVTEEVVATEQAADDNDGVETEKDTAKSADENIILYQIEAGDSFFELRKKFKVKRQELELLNPELKTTGLEPGKYIIIPKKKKKEEAPWLDKLFKKIDRSDTTFTADVDTAASEEVKKSDELFIVGLMLPFCTDKFIDTLEGKQGIDRLSYIAIDFYNGFLMAADSLSARGMNININVFDTKNSVYTIGKAIDSTDFGVHDLIVGPLFKDNIEFAAERLKKEDVMLVNPLSKAVDYKTHKNIIQCRSSREAYADKIAEVLNRDYADDHVVFAHTGKTEELEELQAIKSKLYPRTDGGSIDNVVFSEEVLRHTDLMEILHEKKKNVFVILGEDNVFLSDLVNNLRRTRDTSIYLMASAKIMQIPTLEMSYLNNLNLTVLDGNRVDYDAPATIDFIKKYRSRYSDEPTRFAFQGYDIGYYFLQALWSSGRDMKDIKDMKADGLYSGFEFARERKEGYVNRFVVLKRLVDLQLVELKTDDEEETD